jgi:DNA polymerase-3 subunit delta
MNEVKAKPTQVPIYVIAGKETSLVNARCEELLAELLEPEQRSMALFVAESDKVSVAQVLDELRTLPFLSDKRVVLLKDADNFVSNNREVLEAYFDKPCDSSVLVMTLGSFPSNTRLAKKLKFVGELIVPEQPKPWQLPPRLHQYATEAHGKKLMPEAAELLIVLTGDQLPRLYSEIDKLALFAADKKNISVGDVESLIGQGRVFGIFNVIDAVIQGDAAAALQRLRLAFAEDRSAEYTFVGAFAYHLRRMFSARALLDKGVKPPQIAGKLRIWHGKDAFFAQLNRASLRKLGALIEELARTDFAIKTGLAGPRTAAEQLVLKLASS